MGKFRCDVWCLDFGVNFYTFFTGEFANNLPDYQKIEIMMFIMGKFPQFSHSEEMG